MNKALRSLAVLALVLAPGVLPVRAQPPQDDEFAAAAKIVERVKAGELTMEKAFDEGLLTRPVLLAIVSSEKALDAERGLWNPGQETYKWTGLLVEKYPEIFENQTFLGYPARIRIAMYFFNKRDPRGAEMMEKIIAELPREKPDIQVLMAALYNLGNHYLYTGEYDKAIATSLKVREFETTPEQQANILLGAARGAWAAGKKDVANKLYQEVIALGYGWATGHAHSDIASHLMAEGKLEEARALMKQPLQGLNGDQFQVILSARLAQSYFETGEWDEAKKWAQTAVQQYEALGNPIKNHGIESTYENAKSLPQQIEQWQKTPVQVMVQKITVKMPKNATQPVRTYFNVNSYRAITPKIVASDPALKTWMFHEPYGYRSRSYKMIGVEVSPEILQRETKPEITVTIEEFPDIVFHIPVAVKEEKEEEETP
jgi:tetratricopeptide (TPR) repeat protein